MKTRYGFVSNSSSSSFIINMNDLTTSQVYKIEHHISQSIELGLDCAEYADEDDAWTIYEQNGNLHGSTMMDNFDMASFLNSIGVPSDKVHWDD